MKYLFREQIVVIEREEHASDSGHARRKNDRVHLVTEGIDTDRARGDFVLADRPPVIPDPAVEQHVAKRECCDRQREHHVVEHARIAAQGPQVVARVIGDRQKEAARSADPLEMIEADARELCEGDGENCEVDPADPEAEGKKTDDGAARDRDRDRGGQAEPRPDTEMNVERRGCIGAEPDVNGVAERELAGEAHHHVPRLAGIGGIEDDDEDGEQIVVGDPGRREQHGEHHRQEGKTSTRHSVEQPVGHVSLLPRMPCGRNSSTSTRSPNENMLFADGVKKRPAMASVKPIRTPPSTAPGIEPSPPVMTMMKASSVKAGPSAGVTSTSSTSMDPAAPTQAAPMPNVSA